MLVSYLVTLHSLGGAMLIANSISLPHWRRGFQLGLRLKLIRTKVTAIVHIMYGT